MTKSPNSAKIALSAVGAAYILHPRAAFIANPRGFIDAIFRARLLRADEYRFTVLRWRWANRQITMLNQRYKRHVFATSSTAEWKNKYVY